MMNFFLKFIFSNGENSYKEDFLYGVIFCVEFGISKVDSTIINDIALTFTLFTPPL